MSPTAAQVLDALGSDTRRAIVELLDDGPRPVVDLAARLPVSRPAVSQHLRVLKDAELVVEQVEGNRHMYQLRREGLGPVYEYFDRLWGSALDRFAELAEQEAGANSRERKAHDE